MKRSNAEIVREYGPLPGVTAVHGLTYDGRHVWFASGEHLHALDPASGQAVRKLDVPASAGMAFDGRCLYQIAGEHIRKVDPESGKILGTIPTPDGAASGMAWADGMLWVGQYQKRRILQVDPADGRVLRTLACDRHVTGVSWVDGQLWHGTWEDGHSEIRRIDPQTGAVQASLDMPEGVSVSGLESDGAGLFYCGGGDSGKIRAVRRPE
ncbi:glutamine cyclotransferase [Bordetella genomosp. 10]|uniref:Glutamine cyclotransferase n=1 Tax=Bordetella genomosp. 10 TaxID=1416804 RepID=A0A261S1M8_9BORD|nr:PQQ-binding-like beta-propeller repeat protein [Bordetella genomosp. 10]OZI31051.1 glutamine cyclotransferase [Bordetella genomosp. 10]